MCALLTGFLPQVLLSFVVLLMCLFVANTYDLYLLFPVMLFYYESFGQFMGMSVYRYFSLLLIVVTILKFRNIRFQGIQVVPFVSFLLYCIAVIAPDDARKAIFAFIDMMCVLVIINHYLNTRGNVNKFFYMYVFSALCSYVTGIKVPRESTANIMKGDDIVELVRYCATFEDPNYAGFFFTIAVIALISLKLFKPVVRYLLTAVLYIMMLSTMSVTAILVNVAWWCIYLLLTKKINVKTLVIIVVVVIIVLGVYDYGCENPDAPIVGMFAYRISEKLDALDGGDINDVTTNRSELSKYHWDYFRNQSLFKMFVGFNAASVLKTDLDGFGSAAHNEYVDLLLNVGIIGTVAWLIVVFNRVLNSLKAYKKSRDGYYMLVILSKVCWVCYAATLTVFGDLRFMFIFFL